MTFNYTGYAGVLENVLKFLDIFSSDISGVLAGQIELLKSQVPDDSQPFEIHEAFTLQLLESCTNALGLNRELLNLSIDEIQSLTDYFYVCKLTIRCKESAVRVSRDVWESIENAIAMPTSVN